MEETQAFARAAHKLHHLFRLTPPGALFSNVILAKTHKTDFGFGTRGNKMT